jgi:transposase InsO family protein
MLGFEVAQSTVSKYMGRRRNPPSQPWKTFLRNQAEAISAIDMCVVPTLTFDLLFAFLVLGHGRRQLLWFEVTRHPTAEWLARQITEAFPWTSAPAYLVRDNDRAYGRAFTSRVRAMGIRDRPISPGSPWQNGCAERLIGTLRRECLDQVAIFGEMHLRRILSGCSTPSMSCISFFVRMTSTSPSGVSMITFVMSPVILSGPAMYILRGVPFNSLSCSSVGTHPIRAIAKAHRSGRGSRGPSASDGLLRPVCSTVEREAFSICETASQLPRHAPAQEVFE